VRDSLQQKCDWLIQNETVMRKVSAFDWEQMIKLAGFIGASAGQVMDLNKVKECKKLLKEVMGSLSRWRGTMSTIVITKMALADDPLEYLHGIADVYAKLIAGKIYHSEYQAMTAMFLYELCPPDKIDDAVERTLAQVELAGKNHPLITTYSQIPLIALMVLQDQDVEVMSERAEECLALVKPLFPLYPETKQLLSYVLACSDKPAQEKVDYFWSFYEELRAAKLEPDLSRMVAILAAYVDLEVPREQLIAEIGEVDKYLKGKKGYGMVVVGKRFRHMMAAALVLADHENEFGAGRVGAMGTAIAEAVVEAIINAIILIIISSSAAAAASSSSH
ncbi:MAG: DUF4003 family protein, partial [Coriobacteriales bacterium]|nr:DUF4003 family protein [Coriobacteriales bacterium]